MSLATNIKEFADVLHNVYAQQLSSIDGTDIAGDSIFSLAIPKAVVLQQACVYLAKSFGSGILYFLSFQWVRDISYLPLLSPEGINQSSTIPDTFLSEPSSYLFSFSKNGVTLFSSALQKDLPVSKGVSQLFNGFFKGDQIVAGVVNSFFFSLPFSLPCLITVRRMFSQGIAAAAASILGSVLAHSLLLGGVLYGVKFLIIPYYSLQPLSFLFGLFAIAAVITEFVKEKGVYLVPLTHYPSLIKIGLLTFAVILCESATVFHDLHHLTLNQQVSYLQLLTEANESSFWKGTQEVFNGTALFFAQTTYLFSFVLGHTFFSLLFCYLLLKGNERLCSFTGWTLPKSARRINRGLLVAILMLTFSGFPYYGLDYLFTKTNGFLPEDPAYTNTVFSPTQVRSGNRHFKSRAPATKNSKTPLELDVNYFDRGMYLNSPKEEKIASDPYIGESNNPSEIMATYDPALTFEELNYQGESAWLMRHERARRVPEEQDSKKDSVFQKPKTHFKQLRLKQDNKQAEAALKEGAQIGAISQWKEGSVASSSTGKERSFLSDENKILPKEHEQDTMSSIRFYQQDKRDLLKELAFEKEIASSYEKSFVSPFGEEADGTPPDLLPVENIIKKRYRLNPVYRALLQTDIDSFIARQPKEYRITQNQEANIFKKRQLLEKYYNSTRYYSPVEAIRFTKNLAEHRSKNEHSLLLVQNQSEKKSFVETVYHQQFKGTLHTVKRFFKVTFDEQQNSKNDRILSYEQSLYKNQSLPEKYNPFLHEELFLERVSPFIEESNSASIYAGWDEKARRFVITNRLAFLQ